MQQIDSCCDIFDTDKHKHTTLPLGSSRNFILSLVACVNKKNKIIQSQLKVMQMTGRSCCCIYLHPFRFGFLSLSSPCWARPSAMLFYCKMSSLEGDVPSAVRRINEPRTLFSIHLLTCTPHPAHTHFFEVQIVHKEIKTEPAAEAVGNIKQGGRIVSPRGRRYNSKSEGNVL